MRFFDVLETRRLFAAGSVDESFGGGDGTVDIRTNTNSWTVSASDVAVDDKGRTLLASVYFTRKQITLTRLLADGNVDTSFGKNGITTISTGFEKTHAPIQIVVDHAGKTLVMFKNRLTRINESGGVDRLFGANGSITMSMFAETGEVAVDAKNRPVVIGTSQGKTGTRGTVARFGPRGALDLSFGSNGVYKTPVPQYQQKGAAGNAVGETLSVLADGSVVAVSGIVTWKSDAERYTGEKGVWAFKLSSKGALDASFGVKGYARRVEYYSEYTSGGSAFEAFYSDGGMIIGNQYVDDNGQLRVETKSWTRIDTNGQITYVPLERLTDDPDQDNEEFIFPPYWTRVIATTPDNKLLVRYNDQVIRYNPNYSFDTSFTQATLPSTAPTLLVTPGRLLSFTSVTEAGQPVRSKMRVTAIEL